MYTPYAVTGEGSRHRRRIARQTCESRDVIRLEPYVAHIGGTGADVFRRDVPAPERFDEPAVSPEQGFTIHPAIVPDDDRLAAAKVEPGHGGLVGHSS